MLTMSRAIALAANEDQSSLEAVATIAAIFIARCVIGSEKRDAVRGEIKSVIETLADGETKVPKSTLNANVALGLKLAFHTSSSKGLVAQDKAFLATVAAEADASTLTESGADGVASLVNMLKLHQVPVKTKAGEHMAAVTTRFRLSRLLRGKEPAKRPLFAEIEAACKKAEKLNTADIRRLQAVLTHCAAVVASVELAAEAARDLADVAARAAERADETAVPLAAVA